MIELDNQYKKAVENIRYWQQGQTFFTAQLYSLMAKSDIYNYAKLAMAFPVEAKAYSDWYHSADPDIFLEMILGDKNETGTHE